MTDRPETTIETGRRRKLCGVCRASFPARHLKWRRRIWICAACHDLILRGEDRLRGENDEEGPGSAQVLAALREVEDDVIEAVRAAGGRALYEVGGAVIARATTYVGLPILFKIDDVWLLSLNAVMLADLSTWVIFRALALPFAGAAQAIEFVIYCLMVGVASATGGIALSLPEGSEAFGMAALAFLATVIIKCLAWGVEVFGEK